MSIVEIKHPGLNLHSSDPSTHEQAESVVFGFWVFLMSDAILFALLFATYGVMLSRTAGGPGPAQEYKISSAFMETMLLLSSSFTFGIASLSMKYKRETRPLLLWLSVTLLLGLAFLGMEINDFVTMIHNGAPATRSGYLSSFYVLVSTHGLHVFSGCIWIIIMIIQVIVFGIAPDVKTRILRLGLFWHFLDIVWVAIFSVVYLQGLAK